jgi:hypothetical protein
LFSESQSFKLSNGKKRGISSMPNTIQLSELRRGNPALTPALGSSLEEACIVCLTDQNHLPGVEMEVEGKISNRYKLYWQKDVSNQMIRCWSDETYTTEQAAYGIAFLLIPRTTNYISIEKSFKGTGFDFWLGDGEEVNDNIFNKKARLEVSGIRKGSITQINTRKSIKYKQTNRSDNTSLPALVVVVEFSKPFSHIGEK